MNISAMPAWSGSVPPPPLKIFCDALICHFVSGVLQVARSRLAEFGAHSMDSLMKKPSAQVCESSIMPLPFGTPFISGQFCIIAEPKRVCRMGQMGSKRAKNGLNSQPCASQMVRDHLLSYFWPKNGQLSALFWALSGPKWFKTGPK